VRKDDHVAREELDRFLPDQARVTAAYGQDVIGDQMLCGRQDPWLQLPGRRRLDAPGLCRLNRVEERAVEANHTQQV
jgi:hypothetical protein